MLLKSSMISHAIYVLMGKHAVEVLDKRFSDFFRVCDSSFADHYLIDWPCTVSEIAPIFLCTFHKATQHRCE